MLDVTVEIICKEPTFQKFSCRVQLPCYNKLTPKSARAALVVAGYYTGTVYFSETDLCGEHTYYKTYRVYPNSCRKILDEVW